jgi:glutathione S-transferase
LLQDDDISVAESGAIVLYLAETYGERNPQLIPAGKRERARWLEWNSFITMGLDATSLYVVRRHGLLPHIYGEAPAAVESSRAYFIKQIAYVDQTLCNTQYLMGDDFTTADMLLTTCLTWATALQIPVPDRCRAYVERVTARDTYKSAFAANARKDS